MYPKMRLCGLVMIEELSRAQNKFEYLIRSSNLAVQTPRSVALCHHVKSSLFVGLVVRQQLHFTLLATPLYAIVKGAFEA